MIMATVGKEIARDTSGPGFESIACHLRFAFFNRNFELKCEKDTKQLKEAGMGPYFINETTISSKNSLFHFRDFGAVPR